jgi:hypothetical protein
VLNVTWIGGASSDAAPATSVEAGAKPASPLS